MEQLLGVVPRDACVVESDPQRMVIVLILCDDGGVCQLDASLGEGECGRCCDAAGEAAAQILAAMLFFFIAKPLLSVWETSVGLSVCLSLAYMQQSDMCTKNVRTRSRKCQRTERRPVALSFHLFSSKTTKRGRPSDARGGPFESEL
jgi:hypothetical protein